ncbi:molybdopterin-synthase adenylyltransferase MoeB [Zunongwangia pacifica]|uniref:Molybdopterin-synthase adenylyltransferase n=1 Tax=Zunongwangia pacifica TaxID=2911062 RepID=A0A9X1ZMQ9_9FLAO|nr:molybdopterin-synthase adenylyltransferase MoeB [Zunongwangia pacifica]MCL6217477.1 molybdopterin-synthase adenylyltransferase MoeB [Zunongwangia pacifica]
MNPERYTRQTRLQGFGEAGQKKLAEARVLVIGAGGLGVPVLQYLSGMGVGTIGIVDNDVVDISNLQRQILYAENDLGQPKVDVAKQKLEALNSEIEIITFPTFISTENALEIIANFDVIVDASDNFPTRYLVNDACVILKKPLIYGALHAFEGQVSVFNFNGGPTYRCLFPEMPNPEEIPDCNENGVLGIIPGIIGSLQALEAVKVITGIGETLSGKLLLFDGLHQSQQKIKFGLNPQNIEIKKLQESYEFSCATQVKSIDAEAFLKKWDSEDIQLIDVRNPEEVERQNLPEIQQKDWKNIPLSELQQESAKIDLQKPTYFLCQSGVRSLKAINLLEDLKIHGNFIDVKGGMNALSRLAPGTKHS